MLTLLGSRHILQNTTGKPNMIALLEDDARRLEAMQSVLEKLVSCACHRFSNTPDLITYLRDNLRSVSLICLDHDLGPNQQRDGQPFDPGTGRDVVNFLANQIPTCPVIIHTSNHFAGLGMEMALREAAWPYAWVVPWNDLEWVQSDWMREVIKQLQLDGTRFPST